MAITVSRTRSWSRAAMPSRMAAEPRLDVMMMIVFLKDTVRPWLSVTRPSSRICTAQHQMLNHCQIYTTIVRGAVMYAKIP